MSTLFYFISVGFFILQDSRKERVEIIRFSESPDIIPLSSLHVTTSEEGVPEVHVLVLTTNQLPSIYFQHSQHELVLPRRGLHHCGIQETHEGYEDKRTEIHMNSNTLAVLLSLSDRLVQPLDLRFTYEVTGRRIAMVARQSTLFCTAGYEACLRLLVYANGTGRGMLLSLSLAYLRALWPFRRLVTVQLVDDVSGHQVIRVNWTSCNRLLVWVVLLER